MFCLGRGSQHLFFCATASAFVTRKATTPAADFEIPDGILFAPETEEIVALKGRGEHATVIDTNNVFATVPCPQSRSLSGLAASALDLW